MSDVAPNLLNDWSPGKIPGAITRKISSLRSAMLRWIVVRGMAWFLGLIILTLAIDFLIDFYAHMDFSQRCIMGILVVGCWVYGLFRFFLKPLKKRPSDDALVLSVEEHLKNENNSLINSLQLARVEDHEKIGQSSTMANHVIGQGVAEAEKLNFQKILNHSASMGHLACLGIFILAFVGIGFGVSNTLYGKLWFQRNVLLQNTKWPTSTVLVVQGVKNGELVIPYGEDYKISVKVADESKVKDVDVFLHYLDQSSSSRQKLSNTDKNPLVHRTVMRAVKSELRFQVSGGDYYSDPIQVRLVKPPGFKSLSLLMTPPPYCKLPPEQLLLSAESFTILVGSRIDILAEADKPDTSISLQSGVKNIPFKAANDKEKPWNGESHSSW